LKRVARRVSIGVARTGGMATNSSGDIFLASSTANPGAVAANASVSTLSNEQMDPIMQATAYATEEAIINALVAAGTMTGRDGVRALSLPHDALREVLRKYNR
jgi:L-aminopeptidase/D-esterase-like protein